MMRSSKLLPASLLAFIFLMGMVATPNASPARTDGADVSTRAPRVVFVIRHGEKPPKEQHSPHLNPDGEERARRIPSLFLASDGRQAPLPRPDDLFATHETAGSNREVETLTPLAHALHLPLDDRYTEDQGAQLAAELLSGKYAGKVVVICWHHGQIPALVKALGIEAAPKWPSDTTFDRIWEIKWQNGEAIMTDLPQNLMSGDSKQ